MVIFDTDKGFCSDTNTRQVVLHTYDIYALEKTIGCHLPIPSPRVSLEDILYDFLDDPDVRLNSRCYTSAGAGPEMITKDNYAQIVDILKNCIAFNKNRPGITFNHIAFVKIVLDDSDDLNNNGFIFQDAVFTNCEFDSSTCILINFIHTKFINTAFRYSKFINCRFIGTEFCECNIHRSCDFYDSSFARVTNPPYVPLACPSEGGFIGWKKASSIDDISYLLIKLYIPANAKRSSATGKKCRCDRAKVLDITTLDGKQHVDEAMSFQDPDFIYKVGEYVIPDWFDPDRWDECSNGIHFFINKQDAIDY